jgi:Family of unknown function (DUF5977)
MLQRRIVSFCVLLFVVLNGSLTSFGQVTLQTGSAVFSLPIFSWQDDHGRLKSEIALGYTSGSGLKVNDVASNEGQGWNLVAGGVISRIQVGEPDDQPGFIGENPLTAVFDGQTIPVDNAQDLTKYPAGYLYDTIPIQRGCPDALTQYPTYGGQNVLYGQHPIVAQDRQMDRFAFQFNGKSGEFVIDTVGGWHGVLLGDSKMQISIQVDPTLINYGIRTTITSFTITDVDGLIYKFTKHGLTKLLSTVFSNSTGAKPAAAPKISNGGVYCQSSFDMGPTAAPWHNANIANPFIINNWYLSEIDDPFTTRKISFSYDSLNLNNSAGTDITYNSGTDNYVVITYKKSITTAQEIASITYPDGHVATFNYATTQRFDFPGEYALSNVTISYTYQGTTRYLSQYQLNTTYFLLNRYGTPSTPYEQGVSRLCLRSVKKIGVDLKEDSPPYQFDYYTSTGSGSADDFVPPPFFYTKDIWGFYNGYNSILYNSPLPGAGTVQSVNLYAANPYALNYNSLVGLCFQNQNVTGTYYNAKPGYAQNGLLKEVIYPTGGSLTYTYAQNTGSFVATPSTVLNLGGVHVSQTSSSDGGYSNGCGTPVVTQYSYVVNGGASSLWGAETPNNSVTSNNFWQEQKGVFTFSITSGFHCKWWYIYPGIESQYDAVSLDEFERIMNALGPVLGALSIITTIDDVVNVLGPETGVGEVIAVAIDIISDVLEIVLSCTHQSKNSYNTIYYNFDLNGIAPLPAQFKQVTITESPGTIGSTVETFTDGDPNDPGGVPDYPLWFPGPNTALSMKQRFAPWAYGLPKMISVYDVNGNLIKQTQNLYDWTYAQQELMQSTSCFASPPNLSYKCQVTQSYSERSDAWESIVQYDASTYYTAATSLTQPGSYNGSMIADMYDTYTGHVNLSTTYERIYRTTDATQYVQTETDYAYNNGVNCYKNPNDPIATNFEVKQITTTQSNGDANNKFFTYPLDYPNGGILNTLAAANIVTIPVCTETNVWKANGLGEYFLNERVTEFAQLPNNDIKPSRLLEQRFSTPQPVDNFANYQGPVLTNYANYVVPEVLTYDRNANLVGLQDEGNRLVTSIYGYNDKYIVATVTNANAVVDKPAYTSFEDTAWSRTGWTVSGIISFNNNAPSVTGSNNFALLSSGANSLKAASLNTATAYTLSFWANNGNVTVTGGATLTKSAPTYNGFTYYEYSIAAGTSSVVLQDNTATNANIDELRLYPVGARMRTSTYDPLVGKTSECDENNRITYYTYDLLGRMQFVEDESHNIEKMYEYNNVSQAKLSGCPATFSSPAISELVARNNCGAGYQGSSVTYTMPAAQFTSTINQFDADVQAEIYFLTNAQAYANTNGSCAFIYYNIAESQTDTTQTCAEGYVGGTVTYTVPANTYSSIISQADANNQALADIAANAQMYANLPANQVCTVSTAPDWEWYIGDSVVPAGPSFCNLINGTYDQIIGLTDVNPNSTTYNQTLWENYGASSACTAANSTTSVVASNSTTQTIVLVYKNTFTGTSYTFSVAPGSSNVTEGSIPNGPYTVTMTPGAPSSSYQILFSMNPGSTQTYYAEVAFGNVTFYGPTCTVNLSPAPNITVNATNQITFSMALSFVNVSNGQTYNFTVPAEAVRTGVAGTLSFTVPEASYNVTITPATSSSGVTYIINGASQTSTGAVEFGNVAITSTSTITIN